MIDNRCHDTQGRPVTSTPPPSQPSAAVPVTLRDIASFRPAPGADVMEPDGWTIAGLDTNFYAVVDRQLVAGTLLGRPASVRFTPVLYHWTYGDGQFATRNSAGATWAAQGRAEFDPTPTSHVYPAQGDYTIQLSIDFRAEYRFGSSAFTPIAGTINLPANDLFITVDGAQTVLVDENCVANPSGPGC